MTGIYWSYQTEEKIIKALTQEDRYEYCHFTQIKDIFSAFKKWKGVDRRLAQ